MTRQRLILGGVCALTLLLAIAVLTDALPWLRGPMPDSVVWNWRYAPRPASRWWPALTAAAIYLAGLALWLRLLPDRFWRAAALAALALGCLGMQLGLVYAERDRLAAELVDRTLAVQTNGYFWTAAQIDDLDAALRDYPSVMRAFESDHARTHPPGLVAAHWLLLRQLRRLPGLTESVASAVYPLRCTDLWLFDQNSAVASGLLFSSLLPLLLGAAALLPAAWLARALGGGRLAVLVGALPALLLFAPIPDQIFATLTLIIVAAFYQGWRREGTGWFFLAGILLSISSFLSLGNTALLLFLGLFGLFLYWRRRPPLRRVAGWTALFLLGASLIWLGYWAGWGVAPWTVARVGLDEHFRLVGAQRSYGVWLPFNLLDLVLFAGIPLAVAFLGGAVAAARALPRGAASDAQGLTVSSALFVLLLILSGTTRGEVGRIWLFLMPLLTLGAALWLDAQGFSRRALWTWGVLQVVWALALGVSWRALEATIVVAQQPPMPALAETATPSGARFGPYVTLEAYSLEQTAEAVTLTLAWKADRPAPRPYTVFNHLVDGNGAIVTQADGWPVDGLWPPSCWARGDLVVAQYRLTLPPELAAGDYTLFTGFYDAKGGVRLVTSGGADALPVATVSIGP